MMGTNQDLLNVARGYLDRGTCEVPNGSDHVPGITDQPGRWDDSWCDMFVMECLIHAGIPVGPGQYGSAWVSTTIGWYRGRGRAFTDPHQAKRGDLVAFDWGDGGAYDHIGIVEDIRADGLVTIEGNVSNRVLRLFRSWGSGMREFATPDFSEIVEPTPPPAPPVPVQEPGVYKIGSTGDFVKKIQQVVGATIDGVYGPETETKVRIWQAKIKVPVDGEWGPQTQDATDKVFAWMIGLTKAPPPNEGDAVLRVLAEASKVTLQNGATGGYVRILQTLLSNKGFPPNGGVDGVFGPGTQSSVRRFQARHGLIQDGIVGPKTWGELLRP